MSDADDQLGGSGDPQFDPDRAEDPEHDGGENDNDVMTDDDLPSGG